MGKAGAGIAGLVVTPIGQEGYIPLVPKLQLGNQHTSELREDFQLRA